MQDGDAQLVFALFGQLNGLDIHDVFAAVFIILYLGKRFDGLIVLALTQQLLGAFIFALIALRSSRHGQQQAQRQDQRGFAYGGFFHFAVVLSLKCDHIDYSTVFHIMQEFSRRMQSSSRTGFHCKQPRNMV